MPERDPVDIGGAPVVTLKTPKPPSASSKPVFVSAQILPGRGMMTLQIKAHLPQQGETDLLDAPPLDKAREFFNEEANGFKGNPSFLVGGAILLPYANRIRGNLSADGKVIRTEILGKPVQLPANGAGKEPGAERHSLHGLLLASRVDEVRRETTDGQDIVSASFRAGDFGHNWLSDTEVSFENVLSSESFSLRITARNVGSELLPMGIGWHPYFTLPSGRREQARLHVPARERTLVNNYDDVFPTGDVVPVAGTPYDFSMPGGRALGGLFLDDCFVDLVKSAEGHVMAEIIDAEASYGLRVVATSPDISAIQVYAPPEKRYIVLEPQFNWADPFGPQWGPDIDTGMVMLQPGEAVTYSARLELFTP
jgi:galactose mutarotase-like enzyme